MHIFVVKPGEVVVQPSIIDFKEGIAVPEYRISGFILPRKPGVSSACHIVLEDNRSGYNAAIRTLPQKNGA